MSPQPNSATTGVNNPEAGTPVAGAAQVVTPKGKPATIALVAGKHSTGAYLSWVEAFITTRTTFKDMSENVLERIFRLTTKPVPENTRVSRGFPELRALSDVPPPSSVWWPSMSHRRGRLIDPKLTTPKQLKMDPKKMSGPKVSDAFAEIFVHPGLGSGLDPEEARFAHAVAIAQALLRIARGEPMPNKAGNIQEYGAPYWVDARAFGFDDKEKKDKYRPTEALRMFLDNILSQVGDIPVGVIEYGQAPGSQGTPGFKVQCPYDLDEKRAAVAKAVRGDKLREAIIDGTIHFTARLTASYNIGKALPWCHRDGHPGGKPLQTVMLSKAGTIVPLGHDPASVRETVVTPAAAQAPPSAASTQRQPRVRKTA